MDFEKYHGAGNDFIIIDNRKNNHFLESNKKHEQIRNMCHRRFGIGADGLIELKNSHKSDFKMVYYNSDGKEGSMCGNGGRCIAAFAWHKGVAGKDMMFEACDGLHQANILDFNKNTTLVDLQLGDVSKINVEKEFIVIDTGSPHYITFVDKLENFDVYNEGKKIRSDKLFFPGGINVNFAQHFEGHLFVRTFERGVENETLSCGTGVVAAAIAAFLKGIKFEKDQYPVKTKGGELSVRFNTFGKNVKFENVWLKGEAVKVFEGFVLTKHL